MTKPVFDLRLPASWQKSYIRTFPGLRGILTIALSLRNWTFGIEFIRGYANGAALVLGPLWIGLAYRDFRRDQRESQETIPA